MENDMVVFDSYTYKKEKINGKKIVNDMFEIFECLGEGSFWKVYLVQRNLMIEETKELQDNNYYVFKEGVLSQGDKYNLDFDPNLNEGGNQEKETCQKEEYRRGVKECSILKIVNHKNISRLYECITDLQLDKIVLIMEWADLGELMKVNKYQDSYEYNIKLMNSILLNCETETTASNVCFDQNTEINFYSHHKALVKVAKFVFKQLLQAIEYLHNNFIVHRDIKPENICFKSSDINVKLIDFSIAKQLSSKDSFINSEGGTPAFDPPEILTQELYDPYKGDVYLIGATLYVFLFNRLQFNFNDYEEESNILTTNYKDLHELFNLMLNENPSYRPTASEIIKHKFFESD